MAEQPPTGMSGDQAERKPLFDPYSGERLKSEENTTEQGPLGDALPGSHATTPAPANPEDAGGKKPWGRGRLISVLVILIAMVCVAAWYITGPRAQAQAAEEKAAAKAVAAKAEKKRALTCETVLGDTFKALSSIDSRLNVGIVEQEFTNAVGEAQAAYDRVDSEDAKGNDCAAYPELADALGQYALASTYWNDCIVGDYCTVDETKLQTWWSDATTTLKAVKANGLSQSNAETS